MQRHGVKRRFDILSSHLAKASAICRKLGLRPMIWSDMYFRLAAKSGDYSAEDARIQPELVPGIPDDLQLVYWDYYHTDPAFYRAAVEDLHLAPDQVVMVGDDIRTDVEGAQRTGLVGVLVRTGKFTEADLAGDITPDAVLDSIADLPRWWAGR